MLHRPRHPFPSIVAVCLGLAAAMPAAASAPQKAFPGFAALKDSLGTIPLVADVVVVEDVLGDVEKVYVDDCRELGARVLDRFETALVAKGYRIEKHPLLSVGQTLSADKHYRHLSQWKQHTMDEAQFPAGPPPLYVDTTQIAGAGSGWPALLRRTVSLKPTPGFPAIFPEAIALRPALGHDYVFVVTVVSNRIPQGKSFLHSMLSPVPAEISALSATSPCDADFNNGVVFSPVSSMLCRVAVVDCRHGEAVWADGECRAHTFSENQVEALTANILKRLP